MRRWDVTGGPDASRRCPQPGPGARITPRTLEAGGAETLDVAGYFGDPDGDELTYSASSSDESVATASVSGSAVTVAAVAAGEAVVTVTASDPGGLAAEQRIAVAVAEAPPPPNRGPEPVGRITPRTLEAGGAETLDVAGYFGDPDGDELTYSASSSDESVATASVSGSAVTVAAVAAGEAVVTVTASDPGGLAAEQRIAVAVAEAPPPPNRGPEPVGRITPRTLEAGGAEKLDVAGYFGDPDGDELTYSASSSDESVATASVSGSAVTVAAVAAGEAVVTVTASDPGGLAAEQRIAVAVAEAPPPPNRGPEPVGRITPRTLEAGGAETLDVAGYFGDPDGDELTYSASSSDESVATASVSGSAVTVAAVAAGEAVVTVTASDPGGLAAEQRIAVAVAEAPPPPNRGPEPVGRITPRTLEAGGAEKLDVAGYFGDPDGDELTYSASSSDESVATASVSGSAVTVAAVAAGEAVVTVTASDPGGLAAEQRIAVAVAEAPPPPNRGPEPVGRITPRTLEAGGAETLDVAGYFGDPDGDELTYSASSSDESVATASVSGSAVTVAAVAAGEAVVTVTASDPGGLAAEQRIAVAVAEAPPPPNRGPEPVGRITPRTLEAGGAEKLDVAGYFGDPDGDELTYSASSSDESVATASVSGSAVTVAAVAAGEAVVTVTASDPGGLAAEQRIAVAVAEAPPPPNRGPEPVGRITPRTLEAGGAEKLDVAGYFGDPDGDELTYSASSSDESVATASVSGSAVTVAAVAAGEAVVTVTASDPGGLAAEQRIAVAVAEAPPPPNRGPEPVGRITPRTLEAGGAEKLDVAGYFGDPDGDELTYSASSSDESVATASVSGSAVTVAAVAAGEAVVTVTASDPGGLAAEQRIAVAVAEAPPPPNRGPEPVGRITPRTLEAGGAEKLDVAGYFGDPDGDELTYSASSSDESVATASVSGSAVTVAAVAAGEAVVTVTASDPGGLAAEQRIAVAVAEAPPPPNRGPEPVGRITPRTLEAGGAEKLDVAGYFGDPDGDELTYSASSSDESVATASVSGSAVTVAAVAAGEAVVTVTASDPGGLAAEQRIAVAVAEAPPPPNRGPEPVGRITPRTLEAGGAEKLDVAGYFGDPDGDELTYSASSSDESVATASVSGSAVTVAAVAAGEAVVTVTASDPGGLAAEQRIAVAVAEAPPPPNRGPEPVGRITPRTLEAGGAEKLDVAGYFGDPDGDELTYSASSSDESVATASVSGSAVTVAAVAAGEAVVTVTASDPGGLAAEQRIAVAVAEAPPPPNRGPEPVGRITPRTLEAGGAEKLDVAGYFGDPDGDELTYSASSSDESVATASVSGSAVTVAAVAAGEAVVTVTASDPGGLAAEQRIAVTVAEAPNRPPVATQTIPDQTIHVRSELQVLTSSKNRVRVRGLPNYFSDPDGDPLRYEASSSDLRYATVELIIIAALDHYVLDVNPVAVGQATITLTATDSEGLSANYVFDVNVRPPIPNRRPVVQWPIATQRVHVGVPDSLRLRDHFRDEDLYGSFFQLNYGASSADNDIALVRVSDKRDHKTGHGYARLVIKGVSAGQTRATVVATDWEGLSVEERFTVIVGTRPPRVTRRISDRSVSADSETYVWALHNYFADPDGGELTFDASSDNAAVVLARVSTHGPYVVLSARTVGTADVTVTATDPTALTASQTFTVTVVAPRPPTITRRISNRSVSVGSETYVYSLHNYFADPEGGELTFDASSADAAVVLARMGNGPLVHLFARTVGTADVTVTATDPTGLTASQTFTVTVGAPTS
ncbi:Ig-like domain-containing protein [Candidatus Palauibacter sp.]|uniref:Ig-like domain-containing protein n=1 Tax=Candidatus Palauibacter sp. TaxID=3101350 RepID=UPI003B5A195D